MSIRGVLAAELLRLEGRSWRLTTRGLARFDAGAAAGERMIVVFWHGKYVPLFALLSGRRGHVFTSASRRGEEISAICSRFGYVPVRISDRPGEGAYAAMRRGLEDARLAAIALDGPLGPQHVPRRGAVRLASDLGFSLVPVSCALRPRKILRRRWDRMEVPLPFSRVALVVGDLWTVPSGLSRDAAGVWTERLARRLEAVDAHAEEVVSGGGATSRRDLEAAPR